MRPGQPSALPAANRYGPCPGIGKWHKLVKTMQAMAVIGRRGGKISVATRQRRQMLGARMGCDRAVSPAGEASDPWPRTRFGVFGRGLGANRRPRRGPCLAFGRICCFRNHACDLPRPTRWPDGGVCPANTGACTMVGAGGATRYAWKAEFIFCRAVSRLECPSRRRSGRFRTCGRGRRTQATPSARWRRGTCRRGRRRLLTPPRLSLR